jgi:hypothetical protein
MRALVLASAIVGLGIGTAVAEPVSLTGDRLDGVTAGTYKSPPVAIDVYKNVAVNLYKNINVFNNLYSAPYVKGNFADAEAAANAYGKDTFSETLTFGEVAEGYYSRSYSESMAATNGYQYKPHYKK